MSRTRFLIVATVIGVVILVGWLLPIREWILWLAASIREAGMAGVLAFFVAYCISTVALLPGSLLTVAAGFAYGPLVGLLITSPASVAGATLAFLLGRTIFRDWVQRKIARSEKARALDRAVGREGFKLVLLLRLSPLVPFNLLNYALSLTNVSFGRYVLASAIGMLPGTAMYVYLGSLATAAAELTSAAEEPNAFRTVLYVVGLLATIAVVIFSTRLARRSLADKL